MSVAPVQSQSPLKDPQLIAGPGSPLEIIQRRCARIAPTESTVLVLGETGTGKEVIARQIHRQSQRAAGPFVPVNCGAIPETLLESELFGYQKGSFTGAASNRRGRIAMAEGGTLFLDEIGELPLSLQVKLLRVLQDHSYEPLGSCQSVPADFRLVAATNRNLEVEVANGRFRQDLYYRLLVCPVRLPALRERPGDVIPLFEHFWRTRGETRPVEAGALGLLQGYDWPGNVRELENLVERLSVCSEGETIRTEDLRANFGTDPDALDRVSPASATVRCQPTSRELSLGGAADGEAPAPHFPIDLPAYIRDLEERYISAALEQTAGNKRAAADLLGLQRTTLVEKLRRKTQRTGGSLLGVQLDPTGS